MDQVSLGNGGFPPNITLLVVDNNHAVFCKLLVVMCCWLIHPLTGIHFSTTVAFAANMNERSMLGERDSEMCVVMEDTIMEDGKMAGQPFRVGKFSHSLRCRLYRCVVSCHTLEYT